MPVGITHCFIAIVLATLTIHPHETNPRSPTESYDKQASLYHEPVYRARRDMLVEQLDEVYDGLKKQQIDNLMAQQHKVMEATMNAQLPDLLTSGKEDTWARVCSGGVQVRALVACLTLHSHRWARCFWQLLSRQKLCCNHMYNVWHGLSRLQLRGYASALLIIIYVHSVGMRRGHVGAMAREPLQPGVEPHASQRRTAAQHRPLHHAQKVRHSWLSHFSYLIMANNACTWSDYAGSRTLSSSMRTAFRVSGIRIQIFRASTCKRGKQYVGAV